MAFQHNDLIQRSKPVLPADYLLYPDPEISLHYHDFAPGDYAVVDHHIHGLRYGAIQLDDGAAGKLDDVLQRELGPAERNANGQLNIQQEVDRAKLASKRDEWNCRS